MKTKEIFCTRLKGLRKENKLTQSDVGAALNVPKQYISRWEKGEQEPNLTTLYQLASYYGCSLDYLLGLSESRERLP